MTAARWRLLLPMTLACVVASENPLPSGNDRDTAQTDSTELRAAKSGVEPKRRPASCRPEFTDPFPARLLDTSGFLAPRFGRVVFAARHGNHLTAHTYRATRFAPASGHIWFVMHGASRNADAYVRAAAPVAERHAALVIGIEFDAERYPSSEAYTLGVMRTGTPYTRSYDPAAWRDLHSYVYSELEHVFEAARDLLHGEQDGYYVFGHSAGAQFTHRLLTFLPHARVLGAVAANAGWYTMPLHGNGRDASDFMPYGLRGGPVQETDLCALLTAPLALLLGETDVATPEQDDLLRDSGPAMSQGSTRLARGQAYFAAGQAQAAALGIRLGWQLHVVPGGHDKEQMLPSAGHLLFAPDVKPCTPSLASRARAVVITEIHADPAAGLAGDANGDGRRDPQQDEFVEIVNTGTEPVCLCGWTLTDAQEPSRHRFPLSGPLPPGGAVVVFGGGVPTGSFGGTAVQWAAFDGQLGLSNAGDVLTLKDHEGTVVSRVSWGDCGGAECATDHITGGLGIGASVVRWPETGGSWKNHSELRSSRWSPGTRVDGSAW